MRKYLLFIFFALFSFSTIDAQIEWTLSEDSTLTISGTSMPDYKFKYFFTRKDTTIAPWYRKSGSIKKIVIKEGVTRIGMWAFRNCYSVSSVEMPNSLTDIADHAFDNCHNITSVTIPNSVTSIGEQAFCNCSSLTSITIPNSVTSIGYGAFMWCDGLTSVTNLATTPQIISSETFEVYGTLHVLPGCKAKYEAADYWKYFTIVEDATTSIDVVEGTPTISSDRIFSISGQQFDKTKKGLNIINGKKILMK